MRQFIITPAAGKRLIGMAMAVHPSVQRVLERGTLAIVAGTTNGYVAEEIFKRLDKGFDFSRRDFFRGITVPQNIKTTEMGLLSGARNFPGDVIIVDGAWKKGATIFDVVDELNEGDLILKGANALHLSSRQAAILISHPKGGTAAAALQAAAGRRVGIIIPVGLEKRVDADLYDMARRMNAPDGEGPRLLLVPTEVVTELESINMLTGAKAELVAGGGVCGAEGCVRISVQGGWEECERAEEILQMVAREPDFASGLR